MSGGGLSIAGEDIRRRFRSGFDLAVDEVEVRSGRTMAILGPSGSGKSTLLSVLGLLERPDAGRVLLDGREVTMSNRRERLLMAAVFQRPYLIKGTVKANVAYGLTLRRVPAAEQRSRVARALELVGMAEFGERSAGTLSGGEAQRVALARALVLEPKVLLLDEPLASLDPLLKRRLVGEFARILRDTGVTVIYVTHDHDEALVVADDIAVMNAGRIVAKGPAADVMALPADEWTAEFLGQEVPGRGVVVESGDGLVHIQAGAGTIIVAAAGYPAGTSVLFSVAPEDVVLAPDEAEAGVLSARNQLRGLVDSAEPRGATWRVVVQVDGVSLASNVSKASFDEIGIAEGRPIRAIFKATAVRVASL